MIYANVVLPVPGGPQNIIEGIFSESKNFLMGPLSPIRCFCPMKSSKVLGLYFDANGSWFAIYVNYTVFEEIFGLKKSLSHSMMCYLYKQLSEISFFKGSSQYSQQKGGSNVFSR